MGKEAQRADAVIDGDEDHAVSRELLAVEFLFRAAAVQERAAVHPEKYGQLIPRLRVGRRPDVQIEAVLAALDLLFGVEFLRVEALARQVG